MISIILLEPEWSSNVGAVARVMANFGFKNLVLVNPKCKYNDLNGVKWAKHGKKVLEKAVVVNWDEIRYDYLIATSAKTGSDYNMPRSSMNPEELALKISKIKGNIGIVFGRESNGLLNTEIKKCDLMVRIGASKYGTLNLSHSVGIILYELYKNKNKEKKITPIAHDNKKNLLFLINDVIHKLEWQTIDKKRTQKILWKRVIGKSFLTKREAFAMFGIFRKIKNNLK